MAYFFPFLLAFLVNLSSPDQHKFHVSYSRVAVEKGDVVVRVRFFADDLNVALARAQKIPTYTNTAGSKPDSTFLAYFNTHFRIATRDGSALKSDLISSGEEQEGQESMWWYMIQYQSPEPIQALHFTNTLLLESFEDQKNIVQVQHFPSEKSWSLYFVEDNVDYTVNFASK